MAKNSNKSAGVPRVFISYARADGEEYAAKLRLRLETEGIPLWQDRIGMEGGRDWWLQITEALDQVEFLVLVMTPAAMQSPIVRNEWRYARQQGVCIYPVKAEPNLYFAGLPHWMREKHFYDLTHEWSKFVNDLNIRCQRVSVPFLVEDLPDDFVPRPHEFEALIGKLLDEHREEPVAITAALRGAGGYGKTTLAKALCHDPRIQEAFDDGVLWVTLGEKPGNLVGKIEDLIYTLSQKRPGFTGVDTAAARLAELLAERDLLLVIDDVWDQAHLKPFLQGGTRCARLITTRNENVLPANTQPIPVDAMHQAEALQLLSYGLDGVQHAPEDAQALRLLAARLGEWALLLKLVNGVLRAHVNTYHQSLPEAIAYSNKALDKHGLAAFDDRNTQERSRAVTKTLQVSFELLQMDEYIHYKELAVFPEDVDIPLATLHTLWNTTGGLDELETEELCLRLSECSLLLHCDLAKGIIRLHDVIRTYLQQEVGAGLALLHAQLLDSYHLRRWAELPHDEPYLWEHLAEHLLRANRSGALIATVKDLRYLASKALVRTAYAMEADLLVAEQQAPDDRCLRLLTRNIVNIGHLLNRCDTFKDAAITLHSRLQHVSELSELCKALAEEIPRSSLTSWHILPDLPHSALVRTLHGHTQWVTSCAVSPQGNFIVSASYDHTLKVWDARSGNVRLALQGHTGPVTSCAVSPQGDFIVSASRDNTLKVWNAHNGHMLFTLQGHTSPVNSCAISPQGDFIVSASEDQTLKVWDAHSGQERLTLQEHTGPVTGCVVGPQGDFIVSASKDQTLKVWDAHRGHVRFTLRGHRHSVNSCAVSPQGDFIVSASSDKTLKVWNARSGQFRLTLQGHEFPVRGCAVSPQENFIVSASDDGTLKVWNAHFGHERSTLQGHTGPVTSCAVSPQGDFIVSASWDEMLKVWDVPSEQARRTLPGHTSIVNGCAFSPRGNFIVSASNDKTLKVWDARSGRVRLSLPGHTSLVKDCAVSPKGDFIVSASWDETLRVWDARSGYSFLSLLGHTSRVNSCVVSPQGDFIVSASHDKTLRVWDARSGYSFLTLRGHTDGVNSCAISPKGDFIVSASDDKTLRVWDARSGQTRLILRGHISLVIDCAVSPQGDFIVSASNDKTLKVWDTYSGQVRLTLQGHLFQVNGCAISPQGDFIISASNDKTLKVWDARTGSCLITLPVEGELNACAFHPDGKHIVAGGFSGVYFLRFLFSERKKNLNPYGRRSQWNIFSTTGSRSSSSHRIASMLAHKVEVEQLDLVEGALLLLRHIHMLTPEARLDQAPSSVREEAQAIVAELGGQRLAIDLAGAYIYESGCSLDDYLDRYRMRRKDLLHQRSTIPSDYPEPAVTSWDLSFQFVKRDNPVAADLLRLCAFLASEAISESMLVKGAPYLSAVLAPVVADPFTFNQAIEELRKFSLIQRNAAVRLLSLHRLGQAILKGEMAEEQQRAWAKCAVQVVNTAFLDERWQSVDHLLSHALICAGHIKQYQLALPEAARVLDRAASALQDRASYLPTETLSLRALAIAETLSLRALALYKKVLGPDHSNTATMLNHLASIYSAQGRHTKAEPLYLYALALYENMLRPDDPSIAMVINNLATLYQDQGRYIEAEPLYQRALAIREKVLGPEHADTAITLSDLAALYKVQGRYVEAEPLYQRALITLSDLAALYWVRGRYVEAELLYQRALAIREKKLGPAHPDTATTLNSMAGLYRDQRRYAEAEPLYQRALAIREKELGPVHLDTATTLNDLATLYRVQGRYEEYLEAEPLYQRALAIREKELGPDHSDTARTLSNLATLYLVQRRYVEAEPLYQRALAIREKELGPDHSDTGTTLYNLATLSRNQDRYAETLNDLAVLYLAQGRYAEAEPLYQHALAIREKVQDPDHLDTGTILYNLATLYLVQGRYAEAEPLYRRALVIYKDVLGLDHPGIAIVLNNLATLYRDQGRYAEAEPLYQHALAIRKKELGPDHPQTAVIVGNYATLLKNMKRGREAVLLETRSQATRAKRRP